MRAALCRVLRAEPHELSALTWAFAYFFLLLCSYYLLRPVRDALAVEAGTEKLQWLFTGTFAAMLALVPAFGWLCARLPRARLLPVVYAFFALNLLLFSARLDAALFFIWLSVFNLFVVSVFWSFMSDLFSAAQAARLYGSIAAGGSCGAIAGPFIAASTVSKVELTGLLLISAALLALTIVCIIMLGRWARAHPRAGDPPPDAPIGGSILAGVRAALSSPFLLGICGYLLCYTALSTALYFAQVDIVRDAVPDAGERTRLFASVDLAVNALTLLVQVLAFARLSAALSPAWLLALMPMLSLAGFLWLGAAPVLCVLIAFGVVRRIGEFSISKPARDALFTVVPREERYKAKNFIDTVIYAGGGRVVDSSPMYGAAESVAGDLIAELGVRERMFIATKVWTSGRDEGMRQMEESFRRLKVQKMDLMQVHNLVDVATHTKTLLEWKHRQRVRYIGITHYTSSAYAEVERWLKTKQYDFVQINYSLAERDAEKNILPLARDLGVAVRVNRPFAEGALFRRVKGKSLPPWTAELGIASWAQFFLKWIASHPAVTCAIPGTGKPEHMLDNLAAGRGRLPDAAQRRSMAQYFDSLS